MTTRPAPCGSPLLFEADNLSIYHARETPSDGKEHSHDDIQIAVPLSGPFHAAWETAAGDRMRQNLPPGSLLVTASQQPHTIQVRKETELAVVWLPSSLFFRMADDDPAVGSAEIVDVGQMQDSLVHHLCLTLLAEVRLNPSPTRLYVDAVTNLLVAHLLRHNTFDAAAPHATGGLPSRTLRRVTAYVQEHLDKDIGLADLARIAGLGESRFGLLFRLSTGLPPYQYVLTQRIERAKCLLRAGKLSVGEIASQTGFCDQSQFTRQFKKHVGMMPKVFARDARR